MKSYLRSLVPLLSALAIAATAFAQGETIPRRTDPGDPALPDGGAPPIWEFVSITGQVPGSTLGNLMVRPSDGSLFVWSMRREYQPKLKEMARPMGDLPRRIDPTDPPFPREGGGPIGLDPKVPNTTVSTLYQFKDGVWIPSLVAYDQTGVGVYATEMGDVFASTTEPDGSLRVFHKFGPAWFLEPLPAGAVGPAGVFAGEGTIYLRTGGAILRHVAHSWVNAYSCGDFAIGGGLADLGNGQIVAPCEGHEHIFDGQQWSTNMETLPTHIHSLWGARDVNGVLHLFAGGSNAEHTEMQVMTFTESGAGSLTGQFEMSLEEPLPVDVGTAPAYVNAVWGDDPHDVYVAGVAHGTGHLYKFNGVGWVNAAPQENLPAIVGLGGIVNGDLWVSLADGRLMRRPAVALATEPTEPSPPPPVRPAVSALEDARGLTVVGAPAAQATLEFALNAPRNVSVSFFDLNGRRVDGMEPGWMTAGVHRLTWNAEGLASGVYFCRLDAGREAVTRKVLIQK